MCPVTPDPVLPVGTILDRGEADTTRSHHVPTSEPFTPAPADRRADRPRGPFDHRTPAAPDAPVTATDRSAPPERPRRRRLAHPLRACRRHPWRTAAASVLVLVLAAAGSSYVQKLTAVGNESAGEKSVEWLRDNHLGPVVNFVENQWYTHHAPPEGGQPPPITVPPVADQPASGPGTVDHLPPPAALTTPAPDAVPGEGQWVPAGPSVGGAPSMYTTQIRPDSTHTSFLELVMWMDPKLVQFRLHPGLEVPGDTWPTPPVVADPQQERLIAAFNGGFRMQDAQGGFYADGRGASSLRAGDATLVIDRSGTATVAQWGRDVTMSDDVSSARQNLALIVDGGQPAPDLDENPNDKWGATVGNKVFVWRSGVGVTADGALVYVAGPSLSAKSLAETLVRAGAVRAMQLDINHDWVSFNTYRTAGGNVVGTKMLPDMVKPGDRYLTPDSRDFVSVALRAPAGTQPAGAAAPTAASPPPPAAKQPGPTARHTASTVGAAHRR